MEVTLKYEPKFGRVLIKREVSEKTKGGIILPENTVKTHAKHEGVIVALGETAGWVEVPEKGHIQTMNVGDRVLFGKYAGTWLDGIYKADGENEGGTLYMCQDADILAIIKE